MPDIKLRSGQSPSTTIQLGFAYTLVVTVGAFAFTGVAVSPIAGRLLSPSVTAFTETGIAATATAARKLAPSTTAFAATGVAATPTAARKLTPGVTAFIETGVSSSPVAARKLTSSVTTLTETGISATALGGRGLSPTVTTFTFTGMAAMPKAGRLAQVSADAYVEAGVAATLAAGRLLATSHAAFVLTGDDATLIRVGLDVPAYRISTLHGTPPRMLAHRGTRFVWGPAQLVDHDFTVQAATGSFILSGVDVDFSTGGDKTLMADTGVFTLSGLPVVFSTASQIDHGVGAGPLLPPRPRIRLRQLALATSTGHFTLSFGPFTGFLGRRLIAASASMVATSAPVTMAWHHQLAAQQAAFHTTAGQDALQVGRRLAPVPGALIAKLARIDGEVGGSFEEWESAHYQACLDAIEEQEPSR